MKHSRVVKFFVHVSGKAAARVANQLIIDRHNFTANLGIGDTFRFFFSDRCRLTPVTEIFETRDQVVERVKARYKAVAGSAYCFVSEAQEGRS